MYTKSVMLTNFGYRKIDTGEVVLNVAIGGEGPPLLLLHGYPESHLAWHAVAPRLASRFSVICPDLRGYGESEKPRGDAAHRAYAKRTMAADLLALMRGLGHRRFAVAGHDRGGVVGHRLALDHPDAVTRLAVLGVVPTLDMWDAFDRNFGVAAYHLALLAQPADFPERLVGAAPLLFLDHTLDAWCATPGAITGQARAAYARAFCDPRTIHAICEDYRAAATVDPADDQADRARGARIEAPVLFLWQQPDGVELPFEPLSVWRRWTDQVEGRALDCGHFLPEERPGEVACALEAFFAVGE
jgi:haloacetate dehalogenase